MPEHTIKVKTKFYTYHQNNSGGKLHKNDDLDHIVIIEAKNFEEANRIAEIKGLYFDGGDCRCCGDRWDEQWIEDGNEEPMVYGDVVSQEYIDSKEFWWDGLIIHYYDGSRQFLHKRKGELS